jgi:hypothetical protein
MSTMMIERTAATNSTVCTSPAGTQTQGNVLILPRCTAQFEKCTGGLKITCKCDDDVACGALQNLCKMLQGGACNCCCTWNGTTVFQCNLCCGHTKCEMTKDGCCFTCTSGDKACCDMLQACCECLSTCCDNGCTCCISLGGTPVCCCTNC